MNTKDTSTGSSTDSTHDSYASERSIGSFLLSNRKTSSEMSVVMESRHVLFRSRDAIPALCDPIAVMLNKAGLVQNRCDRMRRGWNAVDVLDQHPARLV